MSECCQISCSPECEHLEVVNCIFSNSYFCRMYRRMLYISGTSGDLIRRPECISDAASNRLDRQADRDGATSADGR